MLDKRTKSLGLLIAVIIIATTVGLFRNHLAQTKEEPVPIEDGQTINFSTGQPIVSQSEEDAAILETSRQEMEEATADITFQPKTQP